MDSTRRAPPPLPPPPGSTERRYLEPRAVCLTRPGDRPVYFPIYTDRSYTFGRSAESELVLPSQTVSRQHGRLSYRPDGRWVYRDLGSTNGSFLSEFPFELPEESLAPLKPGVAHVVNAGQAVVLAKGGRLTLLLELPAEAVAMSPPSASDGSAGSSATQRLHELVMESALHQMPVFLLGPTGSGKTYFARRIHEQSNRPGAFESVNCGALSRDADQLRSELLGHVAGAFTGAGRERMGKLRHADGGTLFLDEVESMPPEAQRFVLDVLEQTGNFAPLGAPAGAEWPAPTFRLIAASKVPLAQSGLRTDLAFRLGRGTVIRVPSLQERRADIPALVETFLSRLRDEQKVTVRFTDEAVGLLASRPWPGHVRELEGVVTAVASRAVARAQLRQRRDATEGMRRTIMIKREDVLRAADERPMLGLVEIGAELLAEHLEQHELALGSSEGPSVVVELAGPPRPAPASAAMAASVRKRPGDYSRQEYQAALARNGGELKATAVELGMSVNTLKTHLTRHGLRDRSGPAT